MKFLNPAGLWLLLGIPILIIIYIIRSSHTDKPVSSTYIWKLSSRFMKRRIPWQIIKNLLTFILQLFILAALALLAARPAVVTGDSYDYIVILDASASMRSENADGTSRFDEACTQIQELAEKVNNGHTMTLLLAADNSSCLIEKSTSTDEIKLALDGVSCTYGSCNTQEALSLAQTICDRSNNPNVIFYTDCQYVESDTVNVINLSNQEWNVSLTGLSASEMEGNTIFTGVLTGYGKDATVSVGLKIDDKVTSVSQVFCPDGTEAQVNFVVEDLDIYHTAEIFIDVRDSLSADNSFCICKKNTRSYSVLLVSASPLYIESALNAFSNCTLTVAQSPEDTVLSGYDVYIFDGIYPDAYPTDGSVLQFGTDKLPDGLGTASSYETESELNINNQLQSEIYNNLTLKDTVVSKYTELTSVNGWDNILFCGSTPVLVTGKTANGMQFSVASFDLHDSNLPMQFIEFITFMKNITEFSLPTILRDTDYEVGDTVSVTCLPSADKIYIVHPDKSIRSLSTDVSFSTYTPTVPGIYTAVMTTKNSGEYVDFFVHIPAGENISVQDAMLDLTIEAENKTKTNERAFSEIWFWVALAALIIVLIEWGVYYHEQY